MRDAGLDSFAALNIMDHMTCLAGLGHTIIVTLHQPRIAIWDMLHQVRLFGEHEGVCYFACYFFFNS